MGTALSQGNSEKGLMECAQNIRAGQWGALLYVAGKVLHIKAG
jgi:hypothetical protein